MKNIKYLFGLLPLLVAMTFIAACDDILEEDVTDKTLVVIAPGDSTTIAGNKVTFMWEPVGGASGYSLQVFSPSIEKVEKVVLDTFAVGTSFATTFDPGQYQWRMRAENSAYSTPYTTGVFWVEGSENIGDYTVKVISPAKDFKTNNSTVTFEWEKIEPATRYELKLFPENESSNDFTGIKETGTKIEKDFRDYFNKTEVDTTIYWQLRAFDAQDRSTVSEKAKLRIDTVDPSVVEILGPADKASFITGEPIEFTWKAVEDEDFKEYKLRITDDEGVEKITYSISNKATVSVKDSEFESALEVGTYLWEIQTFDQLDNKSSSVKREFSIKAQ